MSVIFRPGERPEACEGLDKIVVNQNHNQQHQQHQQGAMQVRGPEIWGSQTRALTCIWSLRPVKYILLVHRYLGSFVNGII